MHYCGGHWFQFHAHRPASIRHNLLAWCEEVTFFEALRQPFVDAHSARRIDVGGKLLSNHLKELISYRHYNMMDQTYIVNEIKEQCCYISRSFAVDLDKCR